MQTRYEIDLSSISLSKFKYLVESRQVHPGRQFLYEGLDDKMQMLEKIGLKSIHDVIKAFSTPTKVKAIAADTGISFDYLVLLNREAKSYKTKTTLFNKNPDIDDAIIHKLELVKLHNTKLFFVDALTLGIDALARQTGMHADVVNELLCLADLLRIWGVGPVFARIVLESGVCSVQQFKSIDMTIYYSEFLKINAQKNYTKAKFSLSDVLYCQQMAQELQAIEINND